MKDTLVLIEKFLYKHLQWANILIIAVLWDFVFVVSKFWFECRFSTWSFMTQVMIRNHVPSMIITRSVRIPSVKILFVLGGQWCFAIAGLSSYFHCYCRTILEYSCHSWAVYHRFPKPLLFRGRAVCNYPPSCWSHTANLCCGIIRPNLGLLAWDLFLCWQYTGWTSAGNCWAKWPSDPGLV